MNGNGVVTKLLAWLWHPSNDEASIQDYAAGLVAVLAVAFLWSTVIKMVE